VITKDLLRVSRRGGYRPQFVAGDPDARRLAARVFGVYQGHVGERRANLDEALAALEREADDYKLVRGFASLLDREATFETRAPLPPRRARRVAFESGEAVGVAGDEERRAALDRAGDRLGVGPDEIEASLYADRDANRVLAAFDSRWDPEELLVQYDLSLAQTALFDATEVRVRSTDPKALVSAAKRLGLLYEIRVREDGGPTDREVVITGPDALFRRTRRYGTAFARLLRTVAATADEWTLEADIDDRGREHLLGLDDGDVSVPGVEPLAEPAFDSGVEADFAARFRALDLDWGLTREPEPLRVGASVMIPDFAFEYRHADYRVFFEVMGFWTPEYVEKKLAQLADVEDVELIVAVDESLGVGEEIAACDHRVVTYSGTVRVKDVVDVLRAYEAELADEVTADLPVEVVPDADVIAVADVAAEHGVPTDALDDVGFPAHRRLGATLVRPAVLDRVGDGIEAGMAFSEAEDALADAGITDASAALSALGYRVAWDGLSGGTVRERSE
jgi:predicted nuclease of restriction endonuclease-like RecB superfamily